MATHRRQMVKWLAVLVLAGTATALIPKNVEPATTPLKFGVPAYHNFQGEVWVHLSVTNLSEANLLLFDGRGWARLEGPSGWVTNALTPRGILQSVVAGSNFVERFTIPEGTKRWTIGYFVPTKSPKEIARLATGWRRQVLAVLNPAISDRKPPAKEFWSEIFAVPVGTSGPWSHSRSLSE